MKTKLYLLALAALLLAAPACQQSYTEKANEVDVDGRDLDQDETGESVHDRADGGMGENENKTEGDNSEQ